MNILEIIVIITIAFCTIAGYYRGFLKTAYSIAAWFLVLVFVTAATPFFTGFLEKNTGLKDAIQEKCADYIEDLAEDQISMEAEGYGAGENSLIPNEIIEAITDSAASTVNGALRENGIYDELADQAAHFIIQGIAFFIAMALISTVTFTVSRMLNFVSKIPIIRGPDKALGAIVGALKGLVFVWLIFYIICICATSEFGAKYMGYIEESSLLKFLYDNNMLLIIVTKLMKK